MNDLTVLILAGGKGTRMKSSRAKVLHRVAGLPMLELVVRAARGLVERSEDVHVVVGHQAETVRASLSGVTFVEQTEQLGTGHAVMAARPTLASRSGNVLILPGDVPLIRGETLAGFLRFHKESSATASVMTAEVDDPSGYGRIVRGPDGGIDRIVEHADATDDQRRIREINSGIYVFAIDSLFSTLVRTRTDNQQKEFYLTDAVGLLNAGGGRVGAFPVSDSDEARGINSRIELAQVDRILRLRKCEDLMRDGVTVVDPMSTWIDADVEIGVDSMVYPGVALEGTTVIGEEVTIRSGCRITSSRVGNGSTILDGSLVVDSELGSGVRVGPRAHLRMHAVLEDGVSVGNYVEVKKSRLGRGTKAMHLAYIGDATIGRNVNIGAGVITCNYDGKNKHRTTIGNDVFVGSDSQLIAPVTIADGAYVAAGSTIHEDVPAGSLAIGRGRQVVKPDWVTKRRQLETGSDEGSGA